MNKNEIEKTDRIHAPAAEAIEKCSTNSPDDYKASLRSIHFDLKKRESVKMFVSLVDELHQQSVLFTIRQDFNLVWVEL